MKRFHIHIAVDSIDQNIQFYSTLFGCEPSVKHHDYAKWMLDDPRINFAISNRSAKKGLDHLGIQAESENELSEIKQRLDTTGNPIHSQDQAACCYASSNKHWITDPQGIAWEAFHTLAEILTFNDKSSPSSGENPFAWGPNPKSSSCCG